MSAVRPLGRDDPAHGRFVSALRDAGLPTDDLDGGTRFSVLPSDANAFGGLEGSGPDQLIRSVVVSHSVRGRGLGRQLVVALVPGARGRCRAPMVAHHVSDCFFAGVGWTIAERASAPEAVRAPPSLVGCALLPRC